jgi:hypothetical protein
VINLVYPWASEALAAGAIACWALDRTEHDLVLAVRGDSDEPVSELRDLLTDAVSALPGGRVVETDWSGADEWPEVHLTASTALAIEVITTTRSRPKRLSAAADLLLEAADAASADPLSRLRWLRAPARRQGTPAETDSARHSAEEDFHRDQ